MKFFKLKFLKKGGQKTKSLFRNLRAKEVKKARSTTNAPHIKKKAAVESRYFRNAKSWADDIYTSCLVSRNRYKVAFFSMAGMTAILALSIVSLIPMQHTELVVVHQGRSGYVWLSTSKSNQNISASWARTKAELAHYVEVRESYDPTMYTHQTSEVGLLSSSNVNQEYELSQSQANKLAPINLLGAKGYRTVQVNSIFQLDSTAQNEGQIQKTHINLAQVSFTATDHFFGDNKTITYPYTALISWKYTGIPTSPSEMLKDWDGFQITDYKIQQVLVGKSQPSA